MALPTKYDALQHFLKRHVAVADVGDRAARRWFALGREFAPLFYGFVAWIIDQAQQGGFDRVYYFTREGEFFAAIHRAIAAHRPEPLPEARVLEVSRVATLLPSLPTVSPETLRPLARRYPRQSPAALLKTLNLDPKDFAASLAQQQLPPDEPIDQPLHDARLVSFLRDAEVQAAIESRRSQQQTALLRYLAMHGLTSAAARAAVVDIGWHGSIQDHLADLLPNTEFHGCYFGLMRGRPVTGPATLTPSPSPAGAASRNMANDSSGRGEPAWHPLQRRSFVGEVITAGYDAAVQYEFLKFVGPLEMLCNAPGGSVADYEIRGGAAVARRRTTPGEEAIYAQCTRYFQAGVLTAVPTLMAYERETLCDYRAHQADCWRQLRTLMTDPPRAIAVAHDRLQHDETFGHGRAIDMGRWIPSGLVLKALLSATARRQLRSRIETVPWPHGFLVARNLRLVCRWLNARYFAALYHPERRPRKAA